MKKNSVSRWITQCFIIIFILTQVVLAAVDFVKTQQDIINEGTERATIVKNALTYMLHHQFEPDKLEYPKGNETYLEARNVAKSMCSSYQVDSIYVYRPEEDPPSRYYYLYSSTIEGLDREVNEKLAQKTVPTEKLYRQELELMGGNMEIQRLILPSGYGAKIVWLAPFYDREERFVGIIGIEYMLTRFNRKIFANVLFHIGMYIVLMSLGLILLRLLVQKRIVKPLHAISGSMNRFAEDGGRIPEPLDIANEDEIGEIKESYEKMAADISHYVSSIEELTREKIANSVQLDVARRIQCDLVPERDSISGSGFDVCSFTRPARKIGGDFYDCFMLDENSLCLVMGDVADKGIPAALFMMSAKNLINYRAREGGTPGEIIRVVNDQLHRNNKTRMFATVWLGILNLITGVITCVNAGHEKPALRKADGRCELVEKDVHGPAIGILPGISYADYEIRMEAGDSLLLYTDGVVEAKDASGGFFGSERMLFALSRAGGEKPDGAIENMINGLDSYVREAEQFDDMAMMCLKYYGRKI